MKYLNFLSKIAFVCNLFFVICWVIQRTHDFIGQADISNIIILLGWAVAPFLNIFVSVWWVAAVLYKKSTLAVWIGLANLLFLIAQVFVHFIL